MIVYEDLDDQSGEGQGRLTVETGANFVFIHPIREPGDPIRLEYETVQALIGQLVAWSDTIRAKRR